MFKCAFNLKFFTIALTVFCGIYWTKVYEKFNSSIVIEEVSKNDKISTHIEKDELFTHKTLAVYNGEIEQPIYLGLLGRVYDVSRGVKHYGPGCAYNFFAGRDASVSFVTGEFNNFVPEKADDVLTLSSSDLLSLLNWEKFYETEYEYKGKLIGRFYDKDGQPTEYDKKFRKLIEKAKKDKANRESIRSKYPDCNIEWSVEKGSHVWCTTSSGGKERDWKGYPRKLYEIGSENFRCACLNDADFKTNEVLIKPYENCEEFSHECYYHVDEK